ncbi:MAG: hypothetical protein IPJ61_06325 [Tessaracoccus sp.]|uniref:hypothetical protein n=1 Tax=Tessaracoccus sp. TaxID=1971211 RepID=UPI001ECB1DD6|nr:hypothetical protein [Tessaracoccus sp.]MBK7820686.1 hypothetical protein [Tessaracoccus sp.]
MQDRPPPAELVVAISSTDDWFQVGTPAQLIAHGATHGGHHAEHEGRRLELDFFDASGRPLRPLLGLDLSLTGFAPFGRPAPVAVEARMRRVVRRVHLHLAQHPSDAATTALQAVPEPGDLPALVRWAHWATIDRSSGHMAGWFHNLLHTLIG